MFSRARGIKTCLRVCSASKRHVHKYVQDELISGVAGCVMIFKSRGKHLNKSHGNTQSNSDKGTGQNTCRHSGPYVFLVAWIEVEPMGFGTKCIVRRWLDRTALVSICRSPTGRVIVLCWESSHGPVFFLLSECAGKPSHKYRSAGVQPASTSARQLIGR